MTESERIRELERKIEELEGNKEIQQTKSSSFLTSAGILTLIASCWMFVFSIEIIIAGFQDFVFFTVRNLSFNLQAISLMASGIIGAIGFALGLSAGIFALKRQKKAFTITCESFLLGSSFAVPLIANFMSYASLVFLPIFILSLISLIFLGVASNSFVRSKLVMKEGEVEYQKLSTVSKERKKSLLNIFAAILDVGIVITGIGVFFSYYANSVILGIQEILSSGSLSQSEKWMYSGSLNWWTSQQLTVYQPLSNFLIIAGVVTIIASLIVLAAHIILHTLNKNVM